MREINTKYFSNESSQNRVTTSLRGNSINVAASGSRERFIKPIIKSIDTTTIKSQNLIESLTPLSDTKRDQMNIMMDNDDLNKFNDNNDDDDDKNSLVAMEE